MSDYKTNYDSDFDGFPNDFNFEKYKLKTNKASISKQAGSEKEYGINLKTANHNDYKKMLLQCTGQILSWYKGDRDETGDKSFISGTGTMIKKIPNNQYLVLTCGHNLCRMHPAKKELVFPKDVYFFPKGSKDFKLRLKYVDAEIYDKYDHLQQQCPNDLAVALFADNDKYEYRASNYYEGITVDNVIVCDEWKQDLSFSLWGYPSLSNGELQGENGGEAEPIQTGFWEYHINTYPGQSGSAIFQKQKQTGNAKQDIFYIYGIHVWGNVQKQENLGIRFDRKKLHWIQAMSRKFCGFTGSLPKQLKRAESVAFSGALKKSEEIAAQWLRYQQLSNMPTYINLPIWYRSDDENLERLVDKAVKEVVALDTVWSDKEFVENMYNDDAFTIAVEEIFKLKFDFFDRFVEDRYKRQFQLHALFDTENNSKETKTEIDDVDDNLKEKKTNDDYIVYYIQKGKYALEEDTEEKIIGYYEELKTEHEEKHEIYEYHIFPKSMQNFIEEDFQQCTEICKFNVEDDVSKGYEWVWWNRDATGSVAQKAQNNGINTYGFWEILNNDNINKENIEKNGVSTAHLNIIFELLRYYYRKMKALQSNVGLQEVQKEDPTMLNAIYCRDGEFIPVKFEVAILIHDDNKEVSLYELMWWNGEARTGCNAISIKNKTVTLEDIKEKYYMRFCTEVVKNNFSIHWQWYDMDTACYSEFTDYGNDIEYKKRLLHKQLEAIFQSNIDTNYPWKYFDRYDAQTVQNCHSFNHAQITHLRPALEENGVYVKIQGYLAHFERSQAPVDVNSESDLNIILHMELVTITNEGATFSRNMRRMKDGKNSLFFYYTGSNVFMNHWLQNYQLSSKAQRLYFWSFILCIAAKMKQIDIEIDNQLVSIPQFEAFLSVQNSDALQLRFDTFDAQNVALYPGFLVPPILDREVAAGHISALSKNTIHDFKKKVNNLSKTRILRKALVREQAQNELNEDTYVWYQTADGGQYDNSLGVMFRFAELIRKFILETRHLGDDTELWPYYKNYFHRNDHQSYHTLINRFNLSLMFSRSDVFELLDEESIVEQSHNIAFFEHFSCAKDVEEVSLQRSERLKSNEVTIRPQRKFAAQLLLQPWDSLRNLNILRQQLLPLLDTVLETIADIAPADNEIKVDEELQKRLIDIAKDYTMDTWKEWIEITNKRLQGNLNNTETGWQLLTEYDIHRVDSIDIITEKYPFFQSFLKHFLLNTTNKQRKDDQEELSHANDHNWYRLFKQSWTLTPEWWSDNHDIVLIELALKYGDKWSKYCEELTGDKASDFMMRLGSSNHDEDDGDRSFIVGHELGEEIQDELRPYLEFQHWCRQKSNMLHRLKYITNILIQNLNEIKPSLVEIRIPRQNDRSKFESKSLLFSEYERNKHLEYIERETRLPEVDNYAMKTAARGYDKKKIMRQAKQTMLPTFDLNDMTKATKMLTETSEEDNDDDPIHWSDEEQTEIRIHDPFIHRNFLGELEEVIHAFNMIQYGPYMSRFIINEIRKYNIPQLWDAFAIVMATMPFAMGFDILNEQMHHLRRSKPETLFSVCKEMVDNSSFGVAGALRMAEYFGKLSKNSNIREEAWKAKSVAFEEMAHELINNIESDHLLYILLTIPLYDSHHSNILSLALEQKRVSFLNNDRILGIMKHVWYHSAAIHVEETVDPRDFEWCESLQMLFFQPFKFYMSPFGFNWTIAVFYFLYLLFVLYWSYLIIKGRDPDLGHFVFWLCNAGYVSYEISEWTDKGREYFSVSDIMNVWDIVISVIWVFLFILFSLEGYRQLLAFESSYQYEQGPSVFINNYHPIMRQIFSLIWAIQVFFVSTRFLALFQNTKYLGSLLKLVQKMFPEIVKFISFATVVVASITFGFYFIFGFNLVNINGDENETATDFWPTFLFTFNAFIEGATSEYTDNYAVPIFAMIFSVIGLVILTNMLIALMTNEYEINYTAAILETEYMWTATCYDLAHRDRLMPPPLNIFVYAIGLLINIIVLPLPICYPTGNVNLYTQITYQTYIFLDSFYCGCNKMFRRKIEELKQDDRMDDPTGQNKQILSIHTKKIYQDRFGTLLSISGWIFFRTCCILRCCKNRIFCCCAGYCDKCCMSKKCFRKCCCNDYDDATSLNTHHKGCYTCVKLIVKDTVTGKQETTIRGISMKQYIERFEIKHKTKLHKEDKILLKHLTMDTLFCNTCYQPYLEKDIDHVLLSGFRVLLDLISCFVFVLTAWFPLVIFFSLMALIETCSKTADQSKKIKSR